MMPPPRPATLDVEGRFDVLCERLEGLPVFAVCDAKVLRLHPHVGQALKKVRARVVKVDAGEKLKSLATVEHLAAQALDLPRSVTVLSVGGGTVGDVATMVAHLHKRGARLVQVPTTLLSAVDASLGGKGAVNVRGVKNALGVFHDADEGWICSELFTTLTAVQRREGWLEAWKMVVALDARLFFSWQRSPPTEASMIQRARALKAAVCAVDPRERTGARAVLNFGHTFGHVLESLSKFRLSHGDAVGLGMLCALDVGWRLGVTPAEVKARVEAALPVMPKARAQLGKVLDGHSWRELEALLSADKKGAYSMVLLERPGQWTRATVPEQVLKEAVASWSDRRRG